LTQSHLALDFRETTSPQIRQSANKLPAAHAQALSQGSAVRPGGSCQSGLMDLTRAQIDGAKTKDRAVMRMNTSIKKTNPENEIFIGLRMKNKLNFVSSLLLSVGCELIRDYDLLD
jgi:hypothetical protein